MPVGGTVPVSVGTAVSVVGGSSVVVGRVSVVAVVAVTTENELVLTEQYRRPVRKRVVDLPAGLVGDIDGEEDEAFELAAQRELLEETGYQGEKFEYVFSGPSSAGMSTEMVAFYTARDVRKVADGGAIRRRRSRSTGPRSFSPRSTASLCPGASDTEGSRGRSKR